MSKLPTIHSVESIIFDLDYCLFDTDSMRAGIGVLLLRYVRDCGGFAELSDEALIDFLWRTPPAEVVAHWRLLADQADGFFAFYRNLPVPVEAILYDDVVPSLETLRTQDIRLFLVTAGVSAFQWRKITHTGLAPYFTEILVVGPGESPLTKRAAMQQLINQYALCPHETLVIGDGAEELAAGRALGMCTVQTMRPGVSCRDANWHISSLSELMSQ